MLDFTIEAWKAHLDPHGECYEQIDDIMVVGIKID